MRPPKSCVPGPPLIEPAALLAVAAAAVLPALPGSGPAGALLLADLSPTAIACVLGLTLAGVTIVARDRPAPPVGGAR